MNKTDFYAFYAIRCFAIGGSLCTFLSLSLSFLTCSIALHFPKGMGAAGVFLMGPAILAITIACTVATASTGQILLHHAFEDTGATTNGDYKS